MSNKFLDFQKNDRKRSELLEESYEIEAEMDSMDDSKELRMLNKRREEIQYQLSKL